MNKNVENFMKQVSADSTLMAELSEKLTGKGEKEQNELLLAFAKEKGFELEKSDFVPEGRVELDEEELKQVVGGGGCGCAVAGGGGGDGLICACVGLGNGWVFKDGKQLPFSQGACYCVHAGAGATRRH